jgi:hypothetical protein
VHTGLQGCTHSWHLCRQSSRETLFSHHPLLNIVPMLWCLRVSWELKTHCPERKAKSEWKREKQNFPKFRFQLHKILSRIQLETKTTQRIKAKSWWFGCLTKVLQKTTSSIPISLPGDPKLGRKQQCNLMRGRRSKSKRLNGFGF